MFSDFVEMTDVTSLHSAANKPLATSEEWRDLAKFDQRIRSQWHLLRRSEMARLLPMWQIETQLARHSEVQDSDHLASAQQDKNDIRMMMNDHVKRLK